MAGLVELIVDKYDGSLKAEHGTGINMAPYVEREWGEWATELMWRVKRLADPRRPLPGLRPHRDPGRHLLNLKTSGDRGPATPASSAASATGCPIATCDDTRQRIVLRRGWPQPGPRCARPRRVEYEALETAPPTAPACSPAPSDATGVRQGNAQPPHNRAGRKGPATAKHWARSRAPAARPPPSAPATAPSAAKPPPPPPRPAPTMPPARPPSHPFSTNASSAPPLVPPTLGQIGPSPVWEPVLLGRRGVADAVGCAGAEWVATRTTRQREGKPLMGRGAADCRRRRLAAPARRPPRECSSPITAVPRQLGSSTRLLGRDAPPLA